MCKGTRNRVEGDEESKVEEMRTLESLGEKLLQYSMEYGKQDEDEEKIIMTLKRKEKIKFYK